jgi:AP-4 complex subunit epsilon-1
MLGDADPSVILPSLNLLLDLMHNNGRDKYVNRIDYSRFRYLDLVPSLVSILKQVVEHNLPHSYDYNKLSAPWLQIRMLEILALLGKGKKDVSHEMYEVLRYEIEFWLLKCVGM